MQLAHMTGSASALANPALGSITLGWRDPFGDYMVRRSSSLRIDESAGKLPALPKGATIADAVRRASEASRTSASPAGTPVGRSYGVLQAADGALAIRPLRMEFDGVAWPVAIDGPLFAQLGATEVGIVRSSKELLAVVGSDSWVDLSLVESARPQPLPA